MKTSPLNQKHLDLNAKMADFGGWLMPIEYPQTGAIAEYTAVRQKVGIFDVYKGDKLPEGKKSYALSFVLQDEDKTLTDKQIDGIIQKLIINFEKEVGASVR